MVWILAFSISIPLWQRTEFLEETTDNGKYIATCQIRWEDALDEDVPGFMRQFDGQHNCDVVESIENSKQEVDTSPVSMTNLTQIGWDHLNQSST